MRVFLEKMSSRLGWEYRGASDLGGLLEIVKQAYEPGMKEPDVLLFDYNLGKATGDSLVVLVRGHMPPDANPLIYFLSGESPYKLQRAVEYSKADGFFSKESFKAHNLSTTLNNIGMAIVMRRLQNGRKKIKPKLTTTSRIWTETQTFGYVHALEKGLEFSDRILQADGPSSKYFAATLHTIGTSLAEGQRKTSQEDFEQLSQRYQALRNRCTHPKNSNLWTYLG